MVFCLSPTKSIAEYWGYQGNYSYEADATDYLHHLGERVASTTASYYQQESSAGSDYSSEADTGYPNSNENIDEETDPPRDDRDNDLEYPEINNPENYEYSGLRLEGISPIVGMISVDNAIDFAAAIADADIDVIVVTTNFELVAAVNLPTGRIVEVVGDDNGNAPTITFASSGFVVPVNRSLTLTNIIVAGSLAADATGVNVQGGNLELIDAEITNFAQSGIRTNAAGGVITMRGTSRLHGNSAYSGGGINIYAGIGNSATVTMYDQSSITNNDTTGGNGGGVIMAGTGGTFLFMYGESTIFEHNNPGSNANHGGGVYMGLASTMRMYDYSSVVNNSSRVHGGGIQSAGTLVISGNARVERNSSGDQGGGGVFISGGNFTMNDDALVAYNTNLGGAVRPGGGVRINPTAAQTAVFTMNGGTIEENIGATNGGGVHIAYNATFVMNSGVIQNHVAANEGGAVHSSGLFEMMGDSRIYNNQAQSGGGVHISILDAARAYRSRFVLSDNAVIEGNSANGTTPAGQGGGVRVAGVGAAIEMHGGAIYNNYAIFGGGVHISGNATTIFTMTGGRIYGNQALLGTTPNNNGGGVFMAANTRLNMTGTALIADNQAFNGGGVNLAGGAQLTMGVPTPGEGGTPIIGASEEVELDGNRTTSNGGGIRIEGASQLTMHSGRIDGNFTHNQGGGIHAVGSGTITMHGGIIYDNESSVNTGGGVHMAGTVVFNMHGGAITNNTSRTNTSQGGGVAIRGNANFNMYGDAEISRNTAVVGGGVAIWGDAAGTPAFTIHSHDVVITNNNASGQGGGVRLSDGVFTMYAGTITLNTAASGGGVALQGLAARPERTAFTMNGGNITTNTSTGDGGGGVNVREHSTFNMNGGAITNNQSGDRGGGVRVWSPTSIFNMQGTLDNHAIISGNTAAQAGGGIAGGGQASPSGAVINITGYSEIINNNASGLGVIGGGGGILLQSGGSLVIDSPNVRIANNNTAGSFRFGGGIRAFGSAATPAAVTISDGAIENNTANTGGGINIGSFTTLNMIGGIVYNNTALINGGGVFASTASATFNLDGGTVADNRAAASGGGAYINVGSLNIESGNIINNTAGADGGGIRATGSGTNITISNGMIQNNTAGNSGGGISLFGAQPTILTITGGNIIENHAAFGGGIGFTNVANFAALNTALGRVSISNNSYVRDNTVTQPAISNNMLNDAHGSRINPVFTNGYPHVFNHRDVQSTQLATLAVVNHFLQTNALGGAGDYPESATGVGVFRASNDPRWTFLGWSFNPAITNPGNAVPLLGNNYGDGRYRSNFTIRNNVTATANWRVYAPTIVPGSVGETHFSVHPIMPPPNFTTQYRIYIQQGNNRVPLPGRDWVDCLNGIVNFTELSPSTNYYVQARFVPDYGFEDHTANVYSDFGNAISTPPFMVTFILRGGTWSFDSPLTIEFDTADGIINEPLEEPAISGYRFTCWAERSEITETVFEWQFLRNYNEDLGVWEYVYTLDDISEDYHRAEGYVLVENTVVAYTCFGFPAAVNRNIFLYAQWEEIGDHTVNFTSTPAEGGRLDGQTTVLVPHEESVLTSTLPDAIAVLGWTTDHRWTSSDPTHGDGPFTAEQIAELEITQDTTFTLIFIPHYIDIIFRIGEGGIDTGEYRTVPARVGQQFPDPPSSLSLLPAIGWTSGVWSPALPTDNVTVDMHGNEYVFNFVEHWVDIIFMIGIGGVAHYTPDGMEIISARVGGAFPAPTLDTTPQAAYDRVGWTPELPIGPVTAGGIFVYEYEVVELTIRFEIGAGGVAAGDYEEFIIRRGSNFPTPTLDTTPQTAYDSIGWTPELPTGSAVADFIFVYEYEVVEFTVRFEIGMGGVDAGDYEEFTVRRGGEFPTPTLDTTPQTEYDRVGWTPELPTGPAAADGVFVYEYEVVEFIIRFEIGVGGTAAGSYEEFTVRRGDAFPAPTLDTNPQAAYNRVGWTPELPTGPTVAGGLFRYEYEMVGFTIRFEIGEGGVAAGDYKELTVRRGDAFPDSTLDTTPQTAYDRLGWTPELPTGPVTSGGVFVYEYEVVEFTIRFEIGAGGIAVGDYEEFTVRRGDIFPATTLDISPDIGWHNGTWSPALPIGDATVNADHSFVFNFVPYSEQSRVTVTFRAGEGGILSDNPHSEEVIREIVLGTMLTDADIPVPIPDTGYFFVRWTQDLVGKQIEEDTIVEAIFAPRYHTVAFAYNTGGSLSGQLIWELRHNTQITAGHVPTAVAMPGYEFAGWTIASASGISENPSGHIVAGNVIFHANFRLVNSSSDNNPGETTPGGSMPGNGGAQNSTPPPPPLPYSVESIYPGDTEISIYPPPQEFHAHFMVGFPSGIFMPYGNLTRAEASALLVRTMTTESANISRVPVDASSRFNDVSANAWYHDYIAAAYSYGLVRGFPDDSFRPNQPISREEFAGILARTSDIIQGELSYSDAAHVSRWARDYVYTMLVLGWMHGDATNIFRPQSSLSRAEAAATINRVLGRGDTTARSIENVEVHIFPDTADPSRWYYFYIIEATNSHWFYREDDDEIWTEVQG